MPDLLRALPHIYDQGHRVAIQAHERAGPLPAPLETFLPGEVDFPSSKQAPQLHGRIIHGDNLQALASMVHQGERVDFIYIDPPFASNRTYHARIRVGAHIITPKTYRDTWDGGISGYLAMLMPRLVLLRDLLSDTGVIAVHIDTHAGHYVKALLDRLFGEECHINDLIWRYGKMSNANRRFPQSHDTILVYGKSVSWHFRPVPGASSEYRTRFIRYLDDERVLMGAVKHSSDKLVRRRIARRERELGRPLRDEDVLFDFSSERKNQDDVFTDISIIKGNARELTGYETQKPVALLERLIAAFCPAGGCVLDGFAGSGTTAVAAARMDRRWVTIDTNALAVHMTRNRASIASSHPIAAIDIGAEPPELPIVDVHNAENHLEIVALERFPTEDLALTKRDLNIVSELAYVDPAALIGAFHYRHKDYGVAISGWYSGGFRAHETVSSIPLPPSSAWRLILTDVFGRKMVVH